MNSKIRIGEIAKFINGYPFKPSDWKTSGQKIIRIQNLTNNTKQYNYSDLELNERYTVRKGDILVSWSATLDVFEWAYEENAFLNQHIFKVEPNYQKIDKGYFKYAIKSVIQAMIQFTHGSTMKHIVKGDFDNTKIPLPPLNEQKLIAETLDKTDELRQKRKKTIELLDEYLRSVFYDMFGDPAKNEKGWETKKCIEFSKLSMGGTPNTKHSEYYGGSINWMKSGDIRNNFIYEIPNKITKEGLNNSNAKIYKTNSVVIALNGQGKTRGTTAVLRVNTASNQSVACFEIENEFINSIYLHFNLKYRYHEIRNITGNDERSGLNLTILRNLKVLIPPIELQNKFAQIVEQVETTKAKMNESLKEMDNLFNSLMQQAFKG